MVGQMTQHVALLMELTSLHDTQVPKDLSDRGPTCLRSIDDEQPSLLLEKSSLDQISQQVHFMRKMSPEMSHVTQEQIHGIVTKAVAPLDAVLGKTQLTLSEINQLQVGDVIQLDASIHDPVCVTVGGIPRFHGIRGRRGEQGAVQVVAFAEE